MISNKGENFYNCLCGSKLLLQKPTFYICSGKFIFLDLIAGKKPRKSLFITLEILKSSIQKKLPYLKSNTTTDLSLGVFTNFLNSFSAGTIHHK